MFYLSTCYLLLYRANADANRDDIISQSRGLLAQFELKHGDC